MCFFIVLKVRTSAKGGFQLASFIGLLKTTFFLERMRKRRRRKKRTRTRRERRKRGN